jgi:hypothetical protein
MVNISLRVLSKPDSSMLSTIFKSLGLDWDERVLPSIGNEILKAVVAQYNAEQLLTQRDKVSKAVSFRQDGRDSLCRTLFACAAQVPRQGHHHPPIALHDRRVVIMGIGGRGCALHGPVVCGRDNLG